MKNKKSNVKKEMLNVLQLLNEDGSFGNLVSGIGNLVSGVAKTVGKGLRVLKDAGLPNYIYVSVDIYRVLSNMLDTHKELALDKIVRVTNTFMSRFLQEQPDFRSRLHWYIIDPHYRDNILDIPDVVHTTLSKEDLESRLSYYIKHHPGEPIVCKGIITIDDLRSEKPLTPPAKPAVPPAKPAVTTTDSTSATGSTPAKPAVTTTDSTSVSNKLLNYLNAMEGWAKAHQSSLIGAGAGAGITAAGWAAARAYLQRQLKNCKTKDCRDEIRAKISKLNKLALISGIGLTALGAAAQPLSAAIMKKENK